MHDTVPMQNSSRLAIANSRRQWASASRGFLIRQAR
jgi:hypothetical protein